MRDLISVIIPVYNVSLYLEKCVNCVINQTYSDIEIILVDDGSTDDSGSICDKFAMIDSRIKVFHKENGGLSDARNYGIDRANGAFLTFIDSDDDVTVDYVEYLYNLLDHKYDMSIASYKLISSKKSIDMGKNYSNTILDTEECLKRMILDDGFGVSACGKLYKKELFHDIRFPVSKLCEDVGTTYKLIDKCDYISYGSKAIYNYYRRSNSIMRSDFSSRKLDLIEMTDQMCDYIKNNYPDLSDLCNNRKVYARLSILRQLSESKNANDYLELRDSLIKYIKFSDYDKKTMSFKEKMAIFSLKVGYPFFKFTWRIFKYIKYKE